MRRSTTIGIAVVLSCFFCATSQAAEVSLRIAWQLNAPLGELVALVKEGNALQKKINPEVRHELWAGMIHGSNVNSASLVIYYKDHAHFAEATAREEANADWGAFLARFPEDKFPTSFVGLSRTLVGAGMKTPVPGEVLNIIAFDLKAPAAELATLIERGREIQMSLNPKSQVRLTASEISGPNVGGAAVLVRYPTLADWAQGTTNNSSSDAWQQFVASMPVAKFPIAYQGLSVAVPID